MSIFDNKINKSVAEAVMKVMQQEELKGNQHKIDANKNGKVDAHDFKLLRAKKDMKKEEVEQLDEVGDTPAGRKALSSYVQKALHDKSRQKGLRKATSRLYKDNYYGKKTNEEVEVSEQEQLNEAFPSVEDAKKRMAAGKTATGTVTKTKTGLIHKRDFEHNAEDDDHPEKVGRPKGYGARQNYKRSTRVNEELSFTEMLELYNEHGIKVLAPIEKEEMNIDGTTIEVIDADKVNGFVETTVEEEVTNDQFTKEFEDQKASFEGKKPQPKVAAGKTTGVKIMPEESELEERTLTSGESKKKEEYVKGMKKGLSGFKQRYGERAKSVMYATATKMAKKD